MINNENPEEMKEMPKRECGSAGCGCSKSECQCKSSEDNQTKSDCCRAKAVIKRGEETIPCEVIYVNKDGKEVGGVETYTKDDGKGRTINDS